MSINNFHPYDAFGRNKAEKTVWDAFKNAFRNDSNCVGYFRYPTFTKTGNLRKEPDIVFAHRHYGLWVIEIKGCTIDNIRSVQGHDWQMQNWYREQETPLLQAEDGTFALRSRLEEKRATRGLLKFRFRAFLPLVTQEEWQNRGLASSPALQGAVWLKEELKTVRQRIQAGNEDNPQSRLDDQQWASVVAFLGGTLPSKPPRDVPTGTPLDNPVRVIQELESRFKLLDVEQQQVAFQIPPGPQRVRGLAGTGKTVLLAKKAAKMHAAHPEWKIAFVFFTRSLYDQILELIALYHREMTREEPNWGQVKVLHAWGAKEKPGFYRTLALSSGIQPIPANRTPYKSPSEAFNYVCEQLEEKVVDLPVLFDAIIIDEGQDLPPAFYRLALNTLSDPQRLIWGYDEAQGIGSLTIPQPKELFGEGVVDMRGSYEGNILKSRILNRCYRTPKKLLMLAHAVNMGLFREGGALQGITQKEEWERIGYEIVEGDFSPASVSKGRDVTITRPSATSPHPIDQDDFPSKDALGDVLTIRTFPTEEEEQEWIADHIAEDIRLGLDPWDIVITGPTGENEANQKKLKGYFFDLQEKLKAKGVPSSICGIDTGADIFRKDGHVTISGIFRAKGNEAWKTYVCRFQYATQPLSWKDTENELHKRNEAFVALTRSRVWCVVTGLDDQPIFAEIERALENYPNMTFPAFNKASLRRQIEEEEDEA